ncbi:MAG TPA: hypothetical protein VN150_11885 [Ochrobactrum sp.]|nr:hypothetical protein [Ochrobactrum sp.]
MNRFAQIACVVIFIAIMVGIHQAAKAGFSWFGGDFAFGFVVGGIFIMALFYLIHRLETRNSSRGR